MGRLLWGTACLAAAIHGGARPARQGSGPPGPDPRAAPSVVLDNARVRVWTASTTRDVDHHTAAVVVPLEDSATRKAGEAYWSGVGGPSSGGGDDRSVVVIVEPKPAPSPASSASPTAADTRPGRQPSTGMSFKPLFENDRVAVMRARMDVGAEEGFHTHASDVIVVHLSGGAIEDTSEGQTVVKRWKHGDVEFEARGSSHSARNLGTAVDVVLVILKP